MRKLWIMLYIAIVLVGCSQSNDENIILANGPISTTQAYEIFSEEYEIWSVRTMIYETKEEAYKIYAYADDVEVVVEIDQTSAELELIEVRDLMNIYESSIVTFEVIQRVDLLVEEIGSFHKDSTLVSWKASQDHDVYILEVEVDISKGDILNYRYDLLKQELISIEH